MDGAPARLGREQQIPFGDDKPERQKQKDDGGGQKGDGGDVVDWVWVSTFA